MRLSTSNNFTALQLCTLICEVLRSKLYQKRNSFGFNLVTLMFMCQVHAMTGLPHCRQHQPEGILQTVFDVGHYMLWWQLHERSCLGV